MVQNATGFAKELLNLDEAGCRITWDGYGLRIKSAKGSGYPCVQVTWYGAAAYCNYRSEMEGRTPCYNFFDWNCNFDADGYRLPTSDEWEYAARGGLSSKRFPWGDTITHSNANYRSRTSPSYDISQTRDYHPDYDDGGWPYTSPVGSFAANGYGLYDMVGNVYEYCTERWPSYEAYRVICGGGWHSVAQVLSYEGGYPPAWSDDEKGFRTVRLTD